MPSTNHLNFMAKHVDFGVYFMLAPTDKSIHKNKPCAVHNKHSQTYIETNANDEH